MHCGFVFAPLRFWRKMPFGSTRLAQNGSRKPKIGARKLLAAPFWRKLALGRFGLVPFWRRKVLGRFGLVPFWRTWSACVGNFGAFLALGRVRLVILMGDWQGQIGHFGAFLALGRVRLVILAQIHKFRHGL